MHTNNFFSILNSVKFNYLRYIFIFLMAILFFGCVSPKKINYFQNEKGQKFNEKVVTYEPTLQIGDILSINVASMSPELALPFNLFESQGSNNQRPLPYIINADGEINFPSIGKFKVAGLTTKEVTNELTKKLLPYLSDPIINVRLVNFKITVLGEVRNPGSYNIQNERISVFEAIGLAGDLTIQGKRNTITLIREQNGKRSMIPMDITNNEIFNSPYFYLAQNDIIYVESNKTKINSSGVGANTSVIISTLSLLVSIAAIIILK